ncbi:uncharacterized protein LOC133188862 [Saccostrea echinata]|uniref:uncharacterized protein LOC133188862 n=1 Tax=Saccostrea echinata TaxID=191078 RepID=UPI002A7F879F|nr:uncharacterized protein LOC133188862 [Saccostrea echinata]
MLELVTDMATSRSVKYHSLMAAAIVCVIPFIHIGIIHKMIWVPNKTPVNRTACRCDCFDTVYKGTYERPGKAGYKHMYFNATFEMIVIWIITLVTIILSYESFKHLINLYVNRNVRWRMLLLFILDIHPNYYSFWSYFNYMNDGFYDQFYHQLFFTITELFSTWNVFRLCSKDSKMESGSVISIIVISLVHILIGGVDQFFVQLILWRDNTFQRFRNLGFLLPDVLHVILTVKEFTKEKQTSWKYVFTTEELRFGLIFVVTGFVVGKLLLR